MENPQSNVKTKDFACPLCELDTDWFRNKELIGECWQCRVKGTEYTCSHCHIYFCDKCAHNYNLKHKLS